MIKPIDSKLPDSRFPVTRSFTGSHSTIPEWEEALVTWLRWNDAYEQLNEKLYDLRYDRDQMALMLGQLDELRDHAVTASRAVLKKVD